MNCIIIDDEPLARKEMKALIEEVSDIQISGLFGNAVTAMELLKTSHIDLVFLDIEMPMVSGLEFAAQVPKQTLIVFTTAYSKYALNSYQLDAIDYLLKPIDKDKLIKAINKAKLYGNLLSDKTEKITLEASTGEFLLIKSERRFHKVHCRDIRFIEGMKDYVVIHTGSQQLITAMNLKTIHQKVPKQIFLRVSKSYIVNLNHIVSFDHNAIYLGDTEIPLGDVYKRDFFKVYSDGSLNL